MATCVACQKLLTLYIEPEEEEEEEDEDEDESMVSGPSANPGSYVDDDVQLQCGCHFHWQCLLDAYSMTECPNCGRNLMTSTESGEQLLLCNLKNEGGFQERLDILPILTEESYLKAYPEERRCRAFLEFCGEGDVEAIVRLLSSNEEVEGDEDDEDTKVGRDIDVLRYQDQIGSMGSGLHGAIQSERVEVAWLLLFLASNLEVTHFPAEVIQAAQTFGLQREDQKGKTDIRALEDSNGRTAEHLAYSIEGVWHDWLLSGRLKPPET